MALFVTSESRLKPLSAKKATIVSILDVGSSKVCCLIAKLKPRELGDVLPGRTHAVEVLGIGHQRSRGIKSGVVVDLDKAEQAIRLAVDAAERMAGVTVESLIVNVSCGRLSSEVYSASVSLTGHEVVENDIKRVLAAGREHTVTPERAPIHSLPIGYAIDGNGGIRDPRGMLGERLGVDMHIVTGESAPLRNLELCISRCHLSVEAMVATPYASGLSALVDDETELGVACVDLGGGTTTISVFMDGQFVHADAIAIGGQHVTTDIARGLSTRIEDAERLKTMHGSALPSVSDERDMLSVLPISDDDRDVPNQIPRAALTRIIRARIEEVLELVRDRLNRSGFQTMVGRRIVLTGGGSQLAGINEAARRILARNVRLGRPLGVTGLPEAARGPAFSAAVGLLIYPQVAQIEQVSAMRGHRMPMTGTGGYFARVGHWFRESF
ncbi:cell division protein FtsA [Mesorhizobium sp. BR1-1-16]|uniref:cell division protein FtsA n=1 Tax=Mesorhizobium sp. BR1-1-16 TaxID=2876653 RepID=UPI001CCC8F22|nr:cell division protein FtsA [Mesorhizobium sp. BR1-1-16]MBZ9937701.1 cell division protein FtsA [Mesorhizobium sp. BR1-1-16]HWJ75006.1 cell division protein FtsA [Kaistia sp.]